MFDLDVWMLGPLYVYRLWNSSVTACSGLGPIWTKCIYTLGYIPNHELHNCHGRAHKGDTVQILPNNQTNLEATAVLVQRGIDAAVLVICDESF